MITQESTPQTSTILSVCTREIVGVQQLTWYEHGKLCNADEDQREDMEAESDQADDRREQEREVADAAGIHEFGVYAVGEGQGVKSWLLRLETTLNFAEGEGNHRGLAAGGAVGDFAVQQVAQQRHWVTKPWSQVLLVCVLVC